MNYVELSNGIVHAEGAIDDHTLCGLTTENLLKSADEFTDEMRANEIEYLPYMAPTAEKITCDHCALIIRHCCKLGTKAINKKLKGGTK